MKEFRVSGSEHDDSRAYVSATAAIVRFDEAKNNASDYKNIYSPKAMRLEASSIASLEGAMVRHETLCRLLGDRNLTNIERSARLAADIHDGLSTVSSWGDKCPEISDIVDVYALSDASSGRLMRPDLRWTIEDDATWVVSELEKLFESPDPWLASEVIRQIWVSGRFTSTSRRMALMLATWAIPIGYGCNGTIFGLAEEIRKAPDAFRDASHNKSAWSLELANAITKCSLREIGKLQDAYAVRATLRALCPAERTSSSIENAIDFFFVQPSFTAKQFCEALGLTSRGAKVVLDKLVEANALEMESISRNRKYTCRRTI